MEQELKPYANIISIELFNSSNLIHKAAYNSHQNYDLDKMKQE